MTALLPPARTLVGPNLVATVFGEGDLDALAHTLLDERLYAHGYVMHAPPRTLDEAAAIAATSLVDPASRDGVGNGRLCYALRLGESSPLGAAGTFVGTSSLGEAHLERESVHLGWTLYHPDFWGTGVNAEAKHLLLGHAFDNGMGRVKIQTDILNTRSQAAIARLGATREGVLRREQPRSDGSWRDTVVFSILVDEWPRVSAGLRERFAATR